MHGRLGCRRRVGPPLKRCRCCHDDYDDEDDDVKYDDYDDDFGNVGDYNGRFQNLTIKMLS